MEFEKLCELVGIEAKIIQYTTPKSAYYGKDEEYQRKEYPELTAEKILALEELFEGFGYYPKNKEYNCFKDMIQLDIFGIGKTRKDALCDLIIKLIEQDILTKEQVKAVIE